MSEAARKFYKTASAIERGGGFGVALDDRALKTPRGNAFTAPTLALADACAREWDAQEGEIKPHTMPLTRIVNVALDSTPGARPDLVAHILQYAETDLVSHRAERPASLVARQSETWDPLVGWMNEALGAHLPVVTGVRAAELDADALRPLAEAASSLDDFRLTALAHAIGLAGSAAIGFALIRGRLNSREAFQAASLDELFSLETWGDDEAARERLAHIYTEFLALERFIAALG
jgi:chaperone required for assembly of F1-ATPase